MVLTSKNTCTANASINLRERVLSGAISAISFDTNIFEMAGLRLEHGYLKHLEQFSKGGVRLVFSEVTLGELRIHMLRKTEEALSTLRKGIADVTTYWAAPDDAGPGLIDRLTARVMPPEKVDARIQEFLNRCKAVIVPASGTVDPSTLVRAYLEGSLPFEAKKKDEFPDAIALMSLEAWARERKTSLLFVTRDKGCQAFCDASPALAWSDNIEDALAHFQVKRNRLDQPVIAFAEEVARGQHPWLLTAIRRAVERDLVNIHWIVIAKSLFDNTNNQIVNVRIIDVALDCDGAVPVFQPVDRSQGTMAVRVKLVVFVEVTCNFYFFIDANPDGEPGSIKLGRTQKNREQVVPLDVLCTFAIKDSHLTQLIEAELVPASRRIDFGDVLPTTYD